MYGEPPALPVKDPTAVSDVIAFLGKQAIYHKPIRTLLLVDDPYHNTATLWYEVLRQGFSANEIELYEVTEIVSQASAEFSRLFKREYDCVIYRNPPVLSSFENVNANIRYLAELLLGDNYHLKRQFSIPDEGIIEIYAKNP